MKKLIFILTLFVSFVAAAQPGPVNKYNTRVRYWTVMADSLLGTPSDTFNLRTPRAISYGWNMFPWITRKNDITYGWSIARQKWEAQTASASDVTIINDSTIQICNGQNVCDTFSVHIDAPTITNVSIFNDTTIIVCNINSCDTVIINNITGPITTTTILNDSTIEVCDSTACDTIVFNSQITNISIIGDTAIQVCGSNVNGPELITNGDFNGNANGWELGALWSYSSNSIVHSFGSTQATAQSGGLVEGGTYRVTAVIGGATGTVDIKLDAGTANTYNAGAGSVSFVGTWNNANNYKIVILPSTDFDGSVTNISVRQILPNCDTIQISPTFFIDTIHIFVESPLHARNDSTFYITRASKLDSGFLSDSDFTYFWHKVDSIYYHPSPSGQDSFLYDNGDTTGILWYVNDVNPNGLISGGKVIPSGTPLIYNVTPAVYRINGIRYTSPSTQLTIPTPDPSLATTHVFVVDTSGHAALVPGTPSNPTLKPSIDVSWQLELTSVTTGVNAPPAYDSLIIYNDNLAFPTEWTPVTNAGTTTNPDNTINVWTGAKSLDVTNINTSDIIFFTAGSPVDISAFAQTGSLNGFFKLKANMPTAGVLNVRFFNGGTPVSNNVLISVTRNLISSYQPFSINMSAFALSSNVVTQLRITYTSNNTNNYTGLYFDYIYLQNGIPNVTTTSNALINVFRPTGRDSVFGTYQDGSISYQFKDSSGGARQTLQQTFDAQAPGSFLTKVDSILTNTGITLKVIAQGGSTTPMTIAANTSSGLLVTSATNSAGQAAIIGSVGFANGNGIEGFAGGTGRSIWGQGAGGGGHNGYFDMTSSTDGGFGVLVSMASYTSGTKGSNPMTGLEVGIGALVSLIPPAPLIVSATKPNDTTDYILNRYFRNTNGGSAGTLVGTSLGSDYWITSQAASPVKIAQELYRLTTSTAGSETATVEYYVKNAGVLNKIITTEGNGKSTFLGPSSPSSTIEAINTTGNAIFAHATSGAAVSAQSSSFTAVDAQSTSGYGLIASTTSGTAAASFVTTPSSPGTVTPVIQLNRQEGTTATNGTGASIDINVFTTTQGRLANQIISKWTTVADATRTSQLSITTVNSGATATEFTLDGNGTGTFLGTYSPTNTVRAINTTNVAVKGEVTGGTGIFGTATTGTGVHGFVSGAGVGVVGDATGGIGVKGQSDVDVAGYFVVAPSSTNTVVANTKYFRSSSGTAANGIGQSLDFSIQDASGGGLVANQIITKWTDATQATRTSQMIFTGVNSAATNNLFILKGDGTVNIPTNVQNFANNAAALSGGLAAGDIYRNGDVLQIVH